MVSFDTFYLGLVIGGMSVFALTLAYYTRQSTNLHKEG